MKELNLTKRVANDSFFNFMQNVFIFLPFLNLGAQIRSPQNRFSVLKSPVDQPMVIVVNPFLANFPFLYPWK